MPTTKVARAATTSTAKKPIKQAAPKAAAGAAKPVATKATATAKAAGTAASATNAATTKAAASKAPATKATAKATKAPANKTAMSKATTSKATVKKAAPPHVAASKAAATPAARPAGKASSKAASATATAAGGKPRKISPEQALANTRGLLDAKREQNRQSHSWQSLGPAPAHPGSEGFQSPGALDKAEELHAGESRMSAIEGSISTRGRQSQGKRDHR